MFKKKSIRRFITSQANHSSSRVKHSLFYNLLALLVKTYEIKIIMYDFLPHYITPLSKPTYTFSKPPRISVAFSVPQQHIINQNTAALHSRAAPDYAHRNDPFYDSIKRPINPKRTRAHFAQQCTLGSHKSSSSSDIFSPIVELAACRRCKIVFGGVFDASQTCVRAFRARRVPKIRLYRTHARQRSTTLKIYVCCWPLWQKVGIFELCRSQSNCQGVSKRFLYTFRSAL